MAVRNDNPKQTDGPHPSTVRALPFRPPVLIQGRYVDLIPLTPEQLPALAEAGRFPEIWTYILSGSADTPERMRELVGLLLERQSAGTDLAFTVVRKSDGAPVGMTRFLNIEPAHDTVEIGGSWLTPSLWRTPMNTDAKRRMLAYAFEVGGVHRVQLRTDLRNQRSQRAIERLGAVREGILREHLVTRDGWHRSSVCYSILFEEWPKVRARLDAELDRPWEPTGSRPPG